MGILANLLRESSGNEKATGDNGKAYGLAQWHQDRQDAFKAWAHKDIHDATHAEQIAFVDYELRQGNEKATGRKLGNSTEAGQAADIVSRGYERPKMADEEASLRSQMAILLAMGSGSGQIDKSLNTGAQAAVINNQSQTNSKVANSSQVETNLHGDVIINAPNAKTNSDIGQAFTAGLSNYIKGTNVNFGLS